MCNICIYCYCCSVAKSCPTLCNPMNFSRLSFPVLHHLLELTQTHGHWIDDAIQPSVVPSSSSLQAFPAAGSFPMSQFFPSGGQSPGASVPVLPMTIQDWFPLGLIGLISLQSKGLTRIFCSTTVRKHQFFVTQPSLWSISHICTWLLDKP